jgi:hypothetical protein
MAMPSLSDDNEEVEGEEDRVVGVLGGEDEFEQAFVDAEDAMISIRCSLIEYIFHELSK